jgi:hypothetical protein
VRISTKSLGVIQGGSGAYQLARELLLHECEAYHMRRRAITVLLAIVISGVTAYPAQDQKSAPKQQKKSDRASSLTGCVDQQEGRYVLVDDRGLNKIADLEADGFPTEGFAKHVGHKVIVRGIGTAGDKPLFKVRAVETVSETCAPANNQQARQ